MSDIEAIRAKMLLALPHWRHAVTLAAKQGDVQFGILAVQPGGAGQIVARFAASEFFDDLATLLGAGPQSKEDTLNAKAQEIVDMVRRSGCCIVDEPVSLTGSADKP